MLGFQWNLLNFNSIVPAIIQNNSNFLEVLRNQWVKTLTSLINALDILIKFVDSAASDIISKRIRMDMCWLQSLEEIIFLCAGCSKHIRIILASIKVDETVSPLRIIHLKAKKNARVIKFVLPFDVLYQRYHQSYATKRIHPKGS